MNNELEQWTILVGEILAPHGIAGEVQVLTLTDAAERFEEGSELCLNRPGGERSLVRIASARPHKGGLIVKMVGFESRDDVEDLRGATLSIHPRMRAALPEGHFYHDEVIGMEVRTVEGEVVGTVTEVLETGSNEVFVTERGLIPATKEVVQSMDKEQKQLVIVPVPGLLNDGS